MKKTLLALALVTALLLLAIAGTVFYYNDKIANLNNEISRLNGIIANFPTPHLVTSLGITEILGNESSSMGGFNPTPIPYNYLYITGSVNNTGKGTAYNAGLHIVAYNATGTLEVNVTVPLSGGIFGTDNATKAFVSKNYGSYHMELRVLDGEQTAYVGGAPYYYGALSILHEGIVTNWTVTPVWTNYP